MSKLPQQYRFIDLSDYGRPIARGIANSLKNTSISPVQVTIWFVISGIIAIICILNHYFWLAGFFLILKSILDAADGELARIKNTPSYKGRYLDSISDIILNFLIVLSIYSITKATIIMGLLAFCGMQLQGTLYNYYYVILRNRVRGDTTSRVFESEIPTALKGETQQQVTLLFRIYKLLYGVFDAIIYILDRKAARGTLCPKWLMTLVSSFGLGFQLLLISVFLIIGMKEYIIPFFMGYTMLIFVFIGIRRSL